MNLDYEKLIGKKIKIVCSFGNEKNAIFYEGYIIEYDSVSKVITLKDRFSKTVFLDSDSVKQVVVVE